MSAIMASNVQKNNTGKCRKQYRGVGRELALDQEGKYGGV